MKHLWLLPAAVLLLASCATLQRSRDQSQAFSIAGLINGGRVEELVKLSSVPFLLDQEILNRPGDLSLFWRGLVQAGYRLEGPELERGGPLTPDSYREFRDSMEVRTFFKKYVKKGTRLLELRTADGRSILLLSRSTLFSRRLYGFRGPF